MKPMMKLLFGSALLSASTVATAAVFDGSAPLLCAVTGTVSCDAQGSCIEGPAEVVNLPVFLKIDVSNKIAQSVRAGGEERTSPILSVHEEGGSLVLLGAEHGAGWSAAIGQDDGKLTLAVSGDEGGFIVFGACTPR